MRKKKPTKRKPLKKTYSRNGRLERKDLPKKTDGTGYNEAFYGRPNRAPKPKPKPKPKYDPKKRAAALARKRRAKK